MVQYGTIITNIGLAKITNAQITHDTVDLLHIALGDGNGAYYVPSQNQTALKKEVWRGVIADMSVSESNPNRVSVSAYISSTVGGFTIREIGLFDTENNLIALSLYPEQYKPQLSEGVSEDVLLHFEIETSNASVVNLAVDPTIIIASRKYVDDKIAASSGAVNNAVQEIKDGSITVLPLLTTDKTLAGAINEVNVKADGNADDLARHLADYASLTKKGHVQLSKDTNSTSDALAATPSAVKAAMDKASAAIPASQKNIANGVAGLGSDGKVLEALLPDLSDGAWERIAFQTLTGNVAQVEFSNIPSGFKYFRLSVNARSSTLSDTSLSMRFNNDVALKYRTQTLRTANISEIMTSRTSMASSIEGVRLSGAGYAPSTGVIEISNFDKSKAKTVWIRSYAEGDSANVGSLLIIQGGAWYDITQEINKISLFPVTGSIIEGSRFELWGCR